MDKNVENFLLQKHRGLLLYRNNLVNEISDDEQNLETKRKLLAEHEEFLKSIAAEVGLEDPFKNNE